MVETELAADLTPNLTEFLNRFPNLIFRSGSTNYTYGKYSGYFYWNHEWEESYKGIFTIDYVDSDESMDMSLLHELGHFLQVPESRILMPNYGFKSGTLGQSLKALNNEIETINISLALAHYFQIEPTSFDGISDTLKALAIFRSYNNHERDEILNNQIGLNQLDYSIDYYIKDLQIRADIISNHKE